jgi:general secretion pathway protein J
VTPSGARGPIRNGFTLVEVMVSLLIFGMIAAAGVAILSFSIRAQGASGKRLDDDSALARTLAVLSADTGQAVDRPARDTGGTLRPAFVGEESTLALVRAGWTNLDAAPRPSLQKVEWRVAGDVLQRVGYPQLDGAQPLPATPMLAGVRGLAIRYRYAGAWSDRWDGAQGVPLPQALEMRLTRTDGRLYRAMFLVGTGYAPTRTPDAGPTPSPSPTRGR